MTQTLLAEDPDQDGAQDTQHQYVTFLVDDRSYGIDINLVREIKQWSATTALPHQPSYTRGVLNLRGTIVPVHDLRARFTGERTETSASHVIVIVWIGTKTVGILVDAVSDIISVAEQEIKQVPSGHIGGEAATISGLVSGDDLMVAILDLGALFPNIEDTASGAHG